LYNAHRISVDEMMQLIRLLFFWFNYLHWYCKQKFCTQIFCVRYCCK